MADDLIPPLQEILDELIRQGVSADDALVIVRNLQKVDWGRIFWDREELALKAGVALATVSYQATRIDSDPMIRPAIRKGAGSGTRAHATLWLGPLALWSMNKNKR